MANDSRLVYSTDQGRIRKAPPAKATAKGDGIVRIRRETSGRKGKGVTTITGLPLDDEGINQLAKKLKQLCATGGTVKNSVVEIQGDHREKIRDALIREGYTVKLAGG